MAVFLCLFFFFFFFLAGGGDGGIGHLQVFLGGSIKILLRGCEGEGIVRMGVRTFC